MYRVVLQLAPATMAVLTVPVLERGSLADAWALQQQMGRALDVFREGACREGKTVGSTQSEL